MLKQITQFKSVIQGIESTFHFDAACPIAIAKEAVFDALKWLGQVEDQIKESQKQAELQKAEAEKAAEEQPKEENNDQPTV